MTPEQYCQEKAAKSGSSFYYSFLFLPKEQRHAITALYAFCREVDDIADAEIDNKIKQVKLEWWRDETDNLFKDNPTHPVTIALLPAITKFNLKKEYFIEIINGMEMDLDKVRYATYEDLHLYCYRVAGVVGILSASIFGYRNPKTLDYAKELGLALQLTNIIRDVHEDAQRNRIYLPQEDLKHFQVTEEMIFQRDDSDKIKQLLTFQSNRALKTYQNAFSLLPEEDRYTQKTGIIMAAIYKNTLHEMIDDGLQVLKHRVVLTPVRKIIIAIQTFIKEWYLHLFKFHYEK